MSLRQVMSTICPPRVETTERYKRCNKMAGVVGVAAAIALLVIAALGSSGHLSAMKVGAALIGVGTGCTLIGYVVQKCSRDKTADKCITLSMASIALGVGIGAMKGQVTLRAVSAIALTGALGYLGCKLDCILPIVVDDAEEVKT